MTARSQDANDAAPRVCTLTTWTQRLAKAAAVSVLALSGLLATPVALAQAPAPADSGGYVPGEKTLESRLLAPCCWAQTLDVHESDITRELRLEIRRRLSAGESPDAIEQDMVARYGEKMRAVPEGKTLTGMGVWLSVLFGVAGIGAAALVVRWVRKRPSDKPTQPDPGKSDKPRGAKRDEWDERLDDELKDIDE